MNNKEQIRKTFDEIKSLSDPMEAIKMLVDSSYDMGIEACGERQSITRRVDFLTKELGEVKTILCGNGDPSHALIARMDRMEKTMDEVKKSTDKIEESVSGNLNSTKPPLNQRMDNVEKITNNATKIVWTIVGFLIVEFLARIFGLF